MKIMRKGLVVLLLLLVASCGKGKRPGLSDQELSVLQVDTAEMKELFQTEVTEAIDSVPPGIKFKESRVVNASKPPIVLNFANRNLVKKPLLLSEYYSKVSYVKLSHPDPAKHLYDLRIVNSKGKYGDLYVKTALQPAGEYILAGNVFVGLLCFDKEGKYLNTIVEGKPVLTNEEPNVIIMVQDQDKNVETVTVDIAKTTGFFGFVTASGENCFYVEKTDKGSAFLCFYNLKTQKCYARIPFKSQKFRPVNPACMAFTSSSFFANISDEFMTTKGVQGDTLCFFRNYTFPDVDVSKKTITNPDDPFFYTLNGQLKSRQAYNDTVWRVVSEQRLEADYILHFGSYRLNMQEGLLGKKKDKLIPYHWMETDKYIFFIYTKNYVCPNTLKSNSVDFFFSYYDKKTGSLYHLPESGTHQSDFFMKTDMEDVLPFMIQDGSFHDGKFYVYFWKSKLDKMMKHKDFASSPAKQQEKMRSLYEELKDGEILVMILE